MKKILILLFALIFSFSFIGASNSETMIVKANVLPKTVSIAIPDEIDFGAIAAGYNSESEKFYVNNTGNTDISVTLNLNNSYSGEVFKNLEFKKSSGNWTKINETFSFSVDKPTELGGIEKQLIYVQLNLENLENVNSETGSIQTGIVFTAMSN